METTLAIKIKKLLAFILIASMVGGASYAIVFKGSFIPNGYDIVAVQKDSLSLKTFNVIGMEKEITSVSFSKEDTWKIKAIEHEVKRYKEFLSLLFAFTTLSCILFIYKFRNGMKLWNALFESNIILSALPIYIIITSLNRIKDLIS